MSEEFKLNPGESVIRRSREVGYEGVMDRKNNELILTSQNLILLKKGLLGKTKEVKYFPLSDIVISDNQAQVKLGKKDFVTYTLDVYFRSGVESFVFTWEDEIKEWVNSINTLLTGQPPIYKTEDWFDDFQNIADSVAGAVDKVRRAFGMKSTEQVSCPCPGCGASLTGTKGETVRCPYCDRYYTF